jgi:hypothetical protein
LSIIFTLQFEKNCNLLKYIKLGVVLYLRTNNKVKLKNYYLVKNAIRIAKLRLVIAVETAETSGGNSTEKLEVVADPKANKTSTDSHDYQFWYPGKKS